MSRARAALMTSRLRAALVALCLISPLMTFDAAAQYPSRALRIIVPYPAGAFNDQFARLLAKHLGQVWRQPAVVENRPGGSTIIGTDLAAKAPADGHTLLITSFAFAVNPSLYDKLPFDSTRDFTPVVLAAQCPNVLVARSSLPARSLPALLADAKERPGALNYASAGNGSSTHLAMELLKSRAGVDLTGIPYKGSAPALTDLMAEQIDVAFDNLPNVLPHVRAGKLRALAVSTARRSAALADIPTVAEAGVAGFDVRVWFGVVVRAGTPPAIVATLNAEINRMLASPATRAHFAAQGVDVAGGTPEEFARFLAEEMKSWGKFIRAENIKAN